MNNKSDVATLLMMFIVAILFAFIMGAEYSGKTDEFITETAATIYAEKNSP